MNATLTNGGTALIYAAGKGNEEIVKLLLEKSADVTAKTVSGKTAKDLARKQGKGPFNIYVNKERWVGGQSNVYYYKVNTLFYLLCKVEMDNS